MAYFKVEGMKVLEGEISCSGSKNAVLPIMAAAVLCPEVHLFNVPDLSDVAASLDILRFLGCRAERKGSEIIIDTGSLKNIYLQRELTSQMRSSILFLGALLGRFKEASIAYPGGCRIGKRPVDLHIYAMEKLGADVRYDKERITVRAKGKNLKGSVIRLSFPSVGATENIILASVLSEGETDILNPAKEPEIDDLISFLKSAGAKIERSENSIHIEGVKAFRKVFHKVMPDRIEAVTFMSYAASTRGKILVNNCCPGHFKAVSEVFKNMGCLLIEEKDRIYIEGPERIKSIKQISTAPYPYFPTDAQAQLSSCLIKAEGISVIEENIFEKRFMAEEEFLKLGADVRTEGKKAFIKGVKRLEGADVISRDLRGGAALIGACLSAEGTSTIGDIFHIERGYEQIERKLSMLGASVIKVSGEQDEKFKREK